MSPQHHHKTQRHSSAGVSVLPTPPTLVESSLQSRLQDVFQVALSTLLPDHDEVTPMVTAADPRFGDYQCNNAMAIFKRQKQEPDQFPSWRSPKDVGEAIKGALPSTTSELLDTVTVAPQGFITLKFRQSWLEEQVANLYQTGVQFRAPSPQRIVIDYSSPNIAKEMHVGHLRSTILGDTAANLLEWLGHDVVRLNHVGDWGTQFGMLLEYMRTQGALEDGSDLVIGDLQQFYRNAKKEFDEDADFRKAAQSNVVALQSVESWARQAWMKICEASRAEFEVIYERLNIKGLTERGESFYNDQLPSVMDTLVENGLVQEDDGALCVFTNVSDAPLIVRKADGGYGYDSTDVAAVLHRLRDEGADRVIYVIDNGQESHMRMVFDVAERAGWLGSSRLDFMGFGLVQGEDGKKFKTRSGDVVRLSDLLNEAASRAEAELRRRVSEGGSDPSSLDDAKLRADAEQIGVAAVKYFDLRQNRNSDYRFSYNAMLDAKGNTAVYLLYAYARLSAILRRAGHDTNSLKPDQLSLTEDSERALALRVLRLPEALAQVEEDLLPNRLIDYVYGLAVDFTSFYTACPVIGSEQELSRIMLCEVTRRTMNVCMSILGIKALDQL